MMTNEEAIYELELSVIETKKFVDFIEEFQGYTNWLNSAKKRIELCNHAIKALDKQIPKKVEKIVHICNESAGHCPSCFNGVNEEMNYCDKCGQALDWSET